VKGVRSMLLMFFTDEFAQNDVAVRDTVAVDDLAHTNDHPIVIHTARLAAYFAFERCGGALAFLCSLLSFFE
jgi:hypothetical protein